jgi:hypothetical protein
MIRSMSVCLLIPVLSAAVVFGAEAKPGGTKDKKPEKTEIKKSESLKVTVVSVKGTAQKRQPDAPKPEWKPIKAKDELNELTVIRTGFGSMVVLKFADRGEVTVRNATKIGISALAKKEGFAKAHLRLKYGSVRAKVDSTKGTNDFQVRTAVATLGITGTTGDVGYFGDKGLGLRGAVGQWVAKGRSFGRMFIRGRQMLANNMTMAHRLALQLRDVRMGDCYGIRPAEGILNNGGGRGLFGGGRLFNPGAHPPPPNWVVFLGSGTNRPIPLIPPGPGGTWRGGGVWISDFGQGTWQGQGMYLRSGGGTGMESNTGWTTLYNNIVVSGNGTAIYWPGGFVGKANTQVTWHGPGWFSKDGLPPTDPRAQEFLKGP